MSQAGIADINNIPIVATSYVTDFGTAIPAGNILNVIANDSPSNDVSGITTEGSGNTVTIFLSNRVRAQTTTIGFETQNSVTFPLGAVPGTYIFQFQIAAYNITSASSAGYILIGTMRTDGSVATLVGAPNVTSNADVDMEDAQVELVANGNEAVTQITGVAGVIDWVTLGTYTFAS